MLLSVGGTVTNWKSLLATTVTISNFATTLKALVSNYNLDGIDLKIENSFPAPDNVTQAIVQLRTRLNELGTGKLITVTAQCGTIYQGVAVPSPSLTDQYYNFLVHIIKEADSSIDYYQVQAYNDWYEFAGGSLQYLQNVYLNWRNLQGMSQWGSTPIAGFSGVSPSKLVMGVLGGGGSYYYSLTTLGSFKNWL